ncbi:MAG: ATP-binding cassette domain-containing protein [Gemmatimonadetes bacterium]|jgi:branched-chain amino acid transport system ATP-binding protein|nr:ATP-binding cassette domain-containing protein [Gemmatimonadota bacterium]MBT6144710.1 ATP-binding cassette domain-containing protein [Gemmatimonadota bacterium]MBT7858761.1 ATP-binding cassette domain-containing protein [Gemmatimonadota bacterium]
MALLEFDHVSVSFDGIQALQDVSLAVEPGQLFALVGPNGAGKTTVFNCLSRICRQDSGQIRFKGHDISHLAPDAVAGVGIGRTFQNLELFSGMTALQNILLGRHLTTPTGLLGSLLLTPSVRRAEIEARSAAETVIELLELEAVRDLAVGTLPYGIRKRIELGRALALEPDLLLLDEPAAGMNVEETAELAWWVHEICSGLGIAILLVEHDMHFVMDISDQVCVLDHGEVVTTGRPDDVQRHPEVIAAYLGTGVEDAAATR